MLKNNRLPSLDILRCVAVLSVIGAHSYPMTIEFYDPVSVAVSSVVHAVGSWGVDLFFILCGFLVSGLLFSEFHRERSMDVKRFYIRRGFKIYPSFYVFLLFSWVWDSVSPWPIWW